MTSIITANPDTEREPLLPNTATSSTGEEAISQRRPWWKRKRTMLKGCGLLFMLSICISGLLLLYLVLSRRRRSDVVLRYPNETIVWKPCGDNEGKPLECGTIVVPMDHFNASHSGNGTFTVPLVRLRGSERASRNVLVNPGGPGVSGVDWFQRWAVNLQKAIGDDFHLIAFDPRGIGASQPAAVCFDDAKTRRTHQVRFDGDVNHDIERYMEVGNYAQACADHMGGHAAHVNTPQTAADMKAILDGLGQVGLYYIGYSYGTTLGATFATMFPERTERVVIDGVLDSFAYYDELSLDFFCEDTDNAFAAFFDECVKETNDCKLSGFGRTGQDIKDNVTALLKRLQNDGPLPVYLNSTMFGTISHDSITNGIFMAMYSSKLWYSLAENLAQLLSGNTTGAFLAYPDLDPTADGSDTTTEHGVFVMNNDRPSGHPAWPKNRYDVLDIVMPGAERCSPWSQGVVQGAMLSAQWKVPKAHGFKPRRGVETRHPILIMSSTYDPVCPISAAKSARASFVGAKLIEVRGIGHTALSLPSSCATRLLRAYMVNGTMPAENHTRCDRDETPYFVSPGNGGAGAVEDATPVLVVDEDVELMATLGDLSGAIPVPQFGRTRF